ncbi:hypothetical protein Pres01_48910 [Metapseudomonas resinovorans]|nr:hypothetical protein Pres01_48910 [Pseudomonas resinovorans]
MPVSICRLSPIQLERKGGRWRSIHAPPPPEERGNHHQRTCEPLIEAGVGAQSLAHQHHNAAAGECQAAEDPERRSAIQQPFQRHAPEGEGGIKHRQHAGGQELVGVNQRSLANGNQKDATNQGATEVAALDLRLAAGQHPAQGQGAREQEAQGGDDKGRQFTQEEVVGQVSGAPADVNHGEGTDQEKGAAG